MLSKVSKSKRHEPSTSRSPKEALSCIWLLTISRILIKCISFRFSTLPKFSLKSSKTAFLHKIVNSGLKMLLVNSPWMFIQISLDLFLTNTREFSLLLLLWEYNRSPPNYIITLSREIIRLIKKYKNLRKWFKIIQRISILQSLILNKLLNMKFTKFF